MPFSSCELILGFFVFLPLAFAEYFGLRLLASKPALLFLLALAFRVVPHGPALAIHQRHHRTKRRQPHDFGCNKAEYSGQSEGYAVGVPRTYAWCSGRTSLPATARHLQFHSGHGMGTGLSESGAPTYSNPDGTIIVANARTYVHLTTTRTGY